MAPRVVDGWVVWAGVSYFWGFLDSENGRNSRFFSIFSTFFSVWPWTVVLQTYWNYFHVFVNRRWGWVGVWHIFGPGRRQIIIWTNVGMLSIRTLGTTLSGISVKRNSYIFIQENAFENVVCKMGAILSRLQCVKQQTGPNLSYARSFVRGNTWITIIVKTQCCVTTIGGNPITSKFQSLWLDGATTWFELSELSSSHDVINRTVMHWCGHFQDIPWPMGMLIWKNSEQRLLTVFTAQQSKWECQGGSHGCLLYPEPGF